MQLIIGLAGPIASGKTTCVDYIKTQYSASSYRFSHLLRDILERAHLPQDRDHLVRISEIMRAEFGEDLLAKAMAKDVQKDDSPIVVVDGVRRLADIEYLKQLPGFVLVEVTAEAETRYQRLTQRTEKSDDASKTFEQFLADEERSTEQSILEVLQHADYTIDNNGPLDALSTQLNALITERQ